MKQVESFSFFYGQEPIKIPEFTIQAFEHTLLIEAEQYEFANFYVRKSCSLLESRVYSEESPLSNQKEEHTGSA